MPFEFKPFDQMTPADYEIIGLKAGLEIHQQLLTQKKLFCRCPAGHYSSDYDAEILRHMRPTLSELGEYDGTALMEFKTKKEIIYRIHRDTVCTYEMDDTPPFMMDETALDIALEVALLLNLNLVNELHIARKQYLDGSIPTGFQRTTILGVDGWIPYRGRKIRIAQLGLEEDACREVSDIGHQRVYLTDRLGMPLIEPVTYPDMRTPQEAAEVGEIIRRLVRATGKVRTGFGAARQDVNVSVNGGTRIEIKGVPKIPRIPLLIYNEAMRQWSLLGIRENLHRRGITPATLKAGAHDITRAVARTQYEPIRKALDRGEQVHCVRLEGFAGILNEITQTDTTFAREISDRVRVIACLTRVPNIVHSDAKSETISAKDWQVIRQRVKAEPGDTLVVVWGDREDVECACNEIVIRAREAAEGVPSETRQALRDGTNGFERILPGADRMYPDTDLPPMALSPERIERTRARLPEPPWERAERYAGFNLPQDILDVLLVSRRAPLFDRLVGKLGIKPVLAGSFLSQQATALRREGLNMELLSDEEIAAVFEAHAERRLGREGIIEVLRKMISEVTPNARGPAADTVEATWPIADQIEAGPSAGGVSHRTGRANGGGGGVGGPDLRVQTVINELGFKPVSPKKVKAMAATVVDRTILPGTVNTLEKKKRFLMGVLMAELRGCADGRRVSEALDQALAAGRPAGGSSLATTSTKATGA
jgi:glutamyl-tRNA(Gln) amidotransferase subunit E